MSDNHFFGLFGLPVAFALDKELLKERLLELQKRHHPDTNNNSQGDISSLLNHAFETLNHEDSRAVHLLSLHGVVLDDTQSINDLDFLDTMLDIRIALEDSQTLDELNALSTQTQHLIDEYAIEFDCNFGKSDYIKASDNTKKLQFLVKLKQDIDRHKNAMNAQAKPANDDDLYV